MVSSNDRAKAAQNSTFQEGIRALLRAPCFELMPFDDFGEELWKLPDGAQISVTASPQLGIEATVEKSVMAARAGYDVVPHLAARYIRGEDHLEELASRLAEAGVTNLFVPAGDLKDAAGHFESAYDLIVALEEFDYPFDEIGITGYPEGHPFLDEATLASTMSRKQSYATYVVTQLCFDPERIIAWIREIRRRHDLDIGIVAGIPGVLKYQRLLRIARKVGVGQSIKFLHKTTGLLEFGRQLLGSWKKYNPDNLVSGLAPYAQDPQINLRGVHLYTFNQVADTEKWRMEKLMPIEG